MSLPFALSSSASIIGTTKEYEFSRRFLNEAFEYQSSIKTRTWVGGVAMFELAVLDLKEAEERDQVRVAAASLPFMIIAWSTTAHSQHDC